jgi:hypothetical protein
MARIRALLRRRRNRILAVVALLLLAFVGAMTGAQHAADSLTVTAWRQSQESQDCGDAAPCAWPRPKVLVFAKTFRDAGTIHAVQDAVNGVPRQDPFYTMFRNGLCSALPGAAVYYYDFRFQWRGVITQEATVASWCSEWHIATLGAPDPLTRFDPFLDNLRVIATWTGMPTPE